MISISHISLISLRRHAYYRKKKSGSGREPPEGAKPHPHGCQLLSKTRKVSSSPTLPMTIRGEGIVLSNAAFGPATLSPSKYSLLLASSMASIASTGNGAARKNFAFRGRPAAVRLALILLFGALRPRPTTAQPLTTAPTDGSSKVPHIDLR